MQNPPPFSDALCHFEDARMGDSQGALDAAQRAGVRTIVWADANPLAPRPTLNHAPPPGSAAGTHLVVARGLHPAFIEDDGARQLAVVRAALEAGQADGLGEIGLDRRAHMPAQSVQEDCLRQQFEWALSHDVPVVLHVVRAHDRMLSLLDEHRGLRGYVHGFRKSTELADAYIRRGLLVSVGPALCGPRGANLRERVAGLGKDGVLVETDAPEPHGPGPQPVTAADVVAVTEALAQSWSCSVEHAASHVHHSLRALFRL